MYSRDYRGATLRFEASGGLVGSALILQDKETDTYWSIMEGEAVAGELAGVSLVELPLGEKMQWRHWRAKHPETLVLSVDGREDAPNVYAEYFRAPSGMFGDATDDRLPSKASVFAFRNGGDAYAVPLDRIESGRTFELEGGAHVFLHRKKGASMFSSTEAYLSSSGFEQRDDGWFENGSGAKFDPEEGIFEDGAVSPLLGFDTFWYTWSLNNPKTLVLE